MTDKGARDPGWPVLNVNVGPFVKRLQRKGGQLSDRELRLVEDEVYRQAEKMLGLGVASHVTVFAWGTPPRRRKDTAKATHPKDQS